MRLFFRLLAISILSSASQAASGTFWKFNGTVNCPKGFRAHFQLREYDWWFDDSIALHPYILLNPKFYEVEGFADDDGVTVPLFSKYYDILMYIVHDCTSDNRRRKVTHYWGEYLVNDTTYYGTKNFELWDAGEITTDINRKSKNDDGWEIEESF